ncbi:hypothetical protein ADUPG1_006035 [Aduncisulcus paluster]|uniref:DUF5714 domain-containing protein n=1 Tax=Aduncisulcus paluster TaxID=2918883 RepID=A0ABQ5KGI7_9EUKA|nr:hypothetical protein ADUPG1_006035 [Aduncisulcus paluster]|eukprot:gnl/Carplike_NY0171/1345_a1827_1070.p1 GENE.gnl/Carplike_NY0171/1345_a1827_1070~~gnl/Carplike_NY0171/1345_a1827_1070.p1  ORF type:complete len:305 (-),score=89.01 gnl/Carplike_NY0171/1345_a1827_1070:208-1122(-)
MSASISPCSSCDHCPSTCSKYLAGLETCDHGCLICGKPLEYFTEPQKKCCIYCGREFSADASCIGGHFVCDGCHSSKSLKILTTYCKASNDQALKRYADNIKAGLSEEECLEIERKKNNMIVMFQEIRAHPDVPIHGPDYHSVVPAVIITAFFNMTHRPIDVKNDLEVVINRGAQIPGALCGFAGACGSAIGAGIALAHITESSPMKAVKRQTALQYTSHMLTILSDKPGARCCRRECMKVMREVAVQSKKYVGIQMNADVVFEPDTPEEGQAMASCEQWTKNKACIRRLCPWWPGAPAKKKVE